MVSGKQEIMQVFVSIQKIKKLSKLISSKASAFERFLVICSVEM